MASITVLNTGILLDYRWHYLARIWQTPLLPLCPVSVKNAQLRPRYSTLVQTNIEVLSLPVTGFLEGRVLMYRYLPSILN